MTSIHGRVAADTDGDVVVFVIGMHVNRLRDVRTWWPAMTAMMGMIKELKDHLLAATGARALHRGSTSAQRIGDRSQDRAPVGPVN